MRDTNSAMLHALATQRSSKYNRFEIHHVCRAQNAEADSLAKQAVTNSLPAECVVDCSPNLAGLSVMEIDGDGWFRTVRATKDLGTRSAADPQAHLLIDAAQASLASFPGAEGVIRVPSLHRAQRDVTPHPTLRLLRSSGPCMSVLGSVALELGIPSHRFKTTAVVLHKLPVPLHIAGRTSPGVRGGMRSTNSVGGLRSSLFPQPYCEHLFWLHARLRLRHSIPQHRSPVHRRRSRSRSRSPRRNRSRFRWRRPSHGGLAHVFMLRGGLRG